MTATATDLFPLAASEKMIRELAAICPDFLIGETLATVLREYDARGRDLDKALNALGEAAAERDSLRIELDTARAEIRDLRADLIDARGHGIRRTIAEARTPEGVRAPIQIPGPDVLCNWCENPVHLIEGYVQGHGYTNHCPGSYSTDYHRAEAG